VSAAAAPRPLSAADRPRVERDAYRLATDLDAAVAAPDTARAFAWAVLLSLRGRRVNLRRLYAAADIMESRR